MKKKVTKSSVVKKKPLTKAQDGYTMKNYLADYPSATPSDTLAQSNPMYSGIRYFGTGKQQNALEKAHTTKYGNPKVGMKPAAPPLTGTKLEADYNSQYKKGGSTSKKPMMKKGGSVKKKGGTTKNKK